MDLKVTGKNFDVGEALRQHISERLQQFRQKYFDRAIRAQVILAKQRSMFQTDISLHLATGMILNAQGEAAEAQASFETAATHLEKQLRRYKQRLKNHQRNHSVPAPLIEATDYVIQSTDDEALDDDKAELNPVIIAESVTNVPELVVGEAVMALEISSLPFVMFKNSKSGALNIVYRRHDGNIGWLDPGAGGVSP